MKTEKVILVVRTGKGSLNADTNKFTDIVDRVDRMVTFHVGWRSVRYKGNRYQLLGGIRTDEFICLNNPIKKRGRHTGH